MATLHMICGDELLIPDRPDARREPPTGKVVQSTRRQGGAAHMNDAKVTTYFFPDDGVVPNNPDLPVIVIARAFDPAGGPPAICAMLEDNGWTGTWTSTVFDFHHYHPDAHEVLAVASGEAQIMLGGPSGQIFSVRSGDCLVLPAGTGHCRLNSSPDFQVCGAYPPGQEDYTTRRDRAEERGDAPSEIRAVPRPRSDPVFGMVGPVTEIWRG
jgi:uncharacterized protein YjlB